mgnify:CR=1 FL=1
MIDLEKHVVEFEGKKYVPFDIAIKAINNIYTEEVDEKLELLQNKLVESIKNISSIKLDD